MHLVKKVGAYLREHKLELRVRYGIGAYQAELRHLYWAELMEPGGVRTACERPDLEQAILAVITVWEEHRNRSVNGSKSSGQCSI